MGLNQDREPRGGISEWMRFVSPLEGSAERLDGYHRVDEETILRFLPGAVLCVRCAKILDPGKGRRLVSFRSQRKAGQRARRIRSLLFNASIDRIRSACVFSCGNCWRQIMRKITFRVGSFAWHLAPPTFSLLVIVAEKESAVPRVQPGTSFGPQP